MAERKRIFALDGLKGISAIIIVFYHYYAHFCSRSGFADIPLDRYVKFIFMNGFLAVELFFMIAGFTTCLTYEKKIRNENLGFISFIKRRTLSLLPLTIITLLSVTFGQLLLVAVTGKTFIDENFDLIHFFRSIFMLEGSVFNEYSFNLPIWFVGALLLCYFLFYIITYLERITRKVFLGYILYFFLVALGWVGMLFQLNYALLGSEFAARGYVTFFIGAIICRLYTTNSNRTQLFMLAVGAVMALLSIFVKHFAVPGQGMLRIVLVWIIYPSIILICIHNNPLKRLLETRVFLFLGSISIYVFYWHFPIQVFFMVLFGILGVMFIKGYLLLPLYIVVVLFFSYECLFIKNKHKIAPGGGNT